MPGSSLGCKGAERARFAGANLASSLLEILSKLLSTLCQASATCMGGLVTANCMLPLQRGNRRELRTKYHFLLWQTTSITPNPKSFGSLRNIIKKTFTFGCELCHFVHEHPMGPPQEPNWAFSQVSSECLQWHLWLFPRGQSRWRATLKTPLVSQHPGAGTSVESSTPWQNSHPTIPSRHFSFPWPPIHIWLHSIHVKEQRLFNKKRICSFSTAYNRFTVYNRPWLLSVPKPTHALLPSQEPSVALLNQPREITKPQQFQSENSTERCPVNFLWCLMNQESVSKQRERKVSYKLGPPISTWSQAATGHGLRQTSLQEPALGVSSAELPAPPMQPSSPHQQCLLSLPDGAACAM